MAEPRRFWGNFDPRDVQIIFGAFDEEQSHCSTDALVKVCRAWLNIRLTNESSSLIEALQKWNGLNPIWEPLNHFGTTLQECFEDHPEKTMEIMERHCAEEIRRAQNRGYISTRDFAGWRSLPERLGENPSEELSGLLERTIRQLEAIGIKDNPVKTPEELRSLLEAVREKLPASLLKILESAIAQRERAERREE